jgi:hypothetical protein
LRDQLLIRADEPLPRRRAQPPGGPPHRPAWVAPSARHRRRSH